ncbi:MAG: ATPase [Deltaproteobacteria bacterium]|nr:MAG: ATPase [Deltaproteobacteria bacterium]
MTTAKAALKKLNDIKDSLQGYFIERDDAVEGLFLSLISKQNMLLLGPPGTAKSMLVNKFAEFIDDGSHFEYLLTKFTVPEELFGPVSLKGLKEDKYERVTRNKLPEAKFVFLDEIWKANSSILNSLLTAVNERIFFNGTKKQRIPLRMLVGASNEYPQDNSLSALYDRFMLKYWVDYINDDSSFSALLRLEDIKVETKLTEEDIEAIQQQEVKWPTDIEELLLEIKGVLKKENFIFSDRKWVSVVKLVTAAAQLKGRDTVLREDFAILSSCLWHEHKDRHIVVSLIEKTIDPFESRIKELEDQLVEIMAPVKSLNIKEEVVAKGLHSVIDIFVQTMKNINLLQSKAETLKDSPKKKKLLNIIEIDKSTIETLTVTTTMSGT